MIKSSVEQLAESIGFDIGNSDDEVQANLLNGLCKGWENSMSQPNMEKQLCYVTSRLSPQAIRVLQTLQVLLNLKRRSNNGI